MNNDKLLEFMQGIGIMAELWIITYKGFKTQGLDDADAMMHTKGFMSVMIDSILNAANNQEDKQ